MRFILCLVLTSLISIGAMASPVDDAFRNTYKEIKTFIDVTYNGLPLTTISGLDICNFLGYKVYLDSTTDFLESNQSYYVINYVSKDKIAFSIAKQDQGRRSSDRLLSLTCAR
jgi:hypothetical protein